MRGAAAWAQESGQVVVPLSDEYLTEWLVLRPFFPNDLEKDFLADVGGEANIQPKEGDTVTTADGKTLTWKRYKSKSDIINLVDAVGYHENATAYAFCVLQSEVADDIQIHLGSDDGVAVWINGERVHYNPIDRELLLDSDIFEVPIKAGANRCLVKVSQGFGEWEFAMRLAMLPPNRAVLSGTITDEAGQPISNAAVRLEDDASDIAQTRTDASGNYQMSVYPVRGPYDLSVTAGNLGDWRLGIRLREGERRKLDLTLKEAISISGTVLALDNATPQVNVLVQAIALGRGDPTGRPRFIAATLSDEEGKYRFINLKPGRYQVWCKILGGDVYYGEEKSTAPTLQVERGKTVKNIDFRFVPFKKRTQKADELPVLPSPSGRGVGGEGSPTTMSPLKPLLEARTYTARVGADAMGSAVVDAQGYTWFIPVSLIPPYFYRFDGKRFTVINNIIGSQWSAAVTGNRYLYAHDAGGKVWMASDNGVVRLWNGKVEKHYTVRDGLPSNTVLAVRADKHEGIWVMTPEGISYIHEENEVNKVSLAVDSRMLNLSGAVAESVRKRKFNLVQEFNLVQAGMEIDSAGGVWWWATQSPDISTTVHRLLKMPQGISEVLKIQLSFKVETAKAVGEGLLLKGAKSPLIYYRADGIGQPLDSRLSRYFGTDAKGKLYFAAEAGDGLMQIIRDELDSEGNFGYPNSPMRFEFPMKLSTGYDYLGEFRNEMWMFNWIADKPVFVIRENEILPGEDLYLSNLMDGGFFMMIDDETVWARKWGKREVIELHFSKGMEYEVCDIDINGLWPLQYNRKTGSYYFILSPSFTSPQPWFPSLMSYQNREWKDLLKFKSSWPSFQTDAGGNTWLADLAEDSTRLICVTADGNLEQQLIQFKELSPDDMGGCYLLDSDGTLTYYKEKKLTAYPLSGIEGARNIQAFSDGSVYLQTGNALYRWTPESLRQMTMKDGLPADSLEEIWKSSSKLFFKAAGQIGWIEDGVVSLVDTRRYPQLKNVTTAQQDKAGRIFFYGNPNEEPIREIWMLKEERLKKLSLPDLAGYPRLVFENDEVVLTTGGDTKIYRYSQEHQQFYTLKNVGDFIGYIWGGYITEGNLIVSGWGKHFLKIDLKNATSTFPPLSFQNISIDKKDVDEQSRYTLAQGAVLKASYTAIEKISQTNVFYQTRLVGLDEAWSEPTKNESIEFRNLPAGTYRLEIRARGESELWGTPIGFDIKVISPFYTGAGFIIGVILAAFFIPTCILTIVLIRQKKQAFEPIENPYIVGNPIRSKEMFFGRRGDFEFIRAKLATGQTGLVIVFAGERRSGKTSILFQIINGELGERFVPVLLDMQAMAVDSEAEFFEKIATEINEALVGAGLKPAPTPTTFREGNLIRTFERFIADAMEALDGKALLLLFDEYELIEAKIDGGVLRPDLITFFASLLEAHPRLSSIFTGSRHLEQRNPTYWYTLIGKSLYRRISFLSERDALRLITEPVKELVVYPRGIPERIVRLTAGQPFYTQVVCQNLVDRLNEVQRNRVRQGDVKAVAQELADNPLPQMLYFWDGLKIEQRSVLSLLGEVLENSSRYASAEMLVNFAQEQKLDLEIEAPEFERVLDELFLREILERERAGEGRYEYRFRVDLFRLWVRQAHSVWQAG